MKLPIAYNPAQTLNVIIETPYKSRNKFAYDKDTGLYKLKKVLPAGLAFPCDMGFIPNTEGEDGDPLDALILMDELTFPGCLVECRLLGVIQATQTEKGKQKRNDRFVCVPAEMKDCDHLKSIHHLNTSKLQAILSFFETYNTFEGKKFKAERISSPSVAHKLIKKQLL